MSYCKESGDGGKDKVIFVTKEDYDQPISSALASIEVDEEEGLIRPNGDINWGCPCLGGMATGPCGQEFREAFSCFHYSTEDMKGSECVDKFRQMSECMKNYPDLYPEAQDEEDADQENVQEETTPEKQS